MNVNQFLRDTENAIRDFLYGLLYNKFGSSYENRLGVSENRVKIWKDRKVEEQKKLASGSIEERLMYYSDFYDLIHIIRKNWSDFPELRDTFHQIKKIEFYLDELEKYRNPDAHRRDILPHQEDLIKGICGEIRSRIIKFRSSTETGESYFPRLEFIRDNLGNYWQAGQEKSILTNKTLFVGDHIEYLITASDPEGFPLKYYCSATELHYDTNKFSFIIEPKSIGIDASIYIGIQSPRKYHAIQGNQLDDWVCFHFTILPERK